jgi:hypothetical protein
MPALNLKDVRGFFQEVREAESADDKGQALERLVRAIFVQVPGLTFRGSNVIVGFKSHEIDIGFRVVAVEGGLPEAVPFLLVECKNWASSVGLNEVRDFRMKLSDSHLRFGVLVAANDVSGGRGSKARSPRAYDGHRGIRRSDRGPYS